MIDPVTGAALIGAGGNLLGGILGHSAQKRANRINIRLQHEQQNWEERMSNTSWQRGAKDMLAAGFNPMLAFNQGGANTPNVSAATVQPVDAMARATSSAADKAMQVASLQNIAANTKILTEKGKQEEFITDDMVNRRLTGRHPTDVAREKEEGEAAAAAATAKLRDMDFNIRKLERDLLEKTFDTQVTTARQRSQLLDKEITGQDLKNYLAQLSTKEAEAVSKWFDAVGAGSPLMKSIMSIGQWLKFILKD